MSPKARHALGLLALCVAASHAAAIVGRKKVKALSWLGSAVSDGSIGSAGEGMRFRAEGDSGVSEETLNHEITWVGTLPPEWELPGAGHLLRGVDVVSGEGMVSPILKFTYGGVHDPYSESPKDGMSRHIFQYPGSNDVFFVPDQLEVKPYASCSFTSSTKGFSSVASYARSASIEAGLSAEFAAIGSLSASASVSRASEGMESGETDLFIASAQCLTAGVQLVSVDEFDPVFVEDFNALPTEDLSQKEIEAKGPAALKPYFKVLRQYGTHMMEKTDLGGVLEQWRFVSKTEVSVTSTTTMAMKVEASVEASVVSANASAGAEHSSSQSSSSGSSQTDATVVAHGGQPGSFAGNGGADQDVTWGAWAATVPGNPVPVNPRYRAMPDVLMTNPKVCSLLTPDDEPACKARLNMLRKAIKPYVMVKADPLAQTYTLYIGLSRDAKKAEAEGTFDASTERASGKDIRGKAAAVMSDKAIAQAEKKVRVCRLQCHVKALGRPKCEATPLVLETQAKGCFSAKNSGGYLEDKSLTALCMSMSPKCNAKVVSVIEATVEELGQVADKLSSKDPAELVHAIDNAAVESPVCKYLCAGDRGIISDDTCGPHFAFVPEATAPLCDKGDMYSRQTEEAQSLVAAQCRQHNPKCVGGGNHVNTIKVKMPSATGKEQYVAIAEANREEEALSLGLPESRRERVCQFVCKGCDARVEMTEAESPGCANQQYVGQEVITALLTSRCTAIASCKAPGIFAGWYDREVPESEPEKKVAACDYLCSDGQTQVRLSKDLDAPQCGPTGDPNDMHLARDLCVRAGVVPVGKKLNGLPKPGDWRKVRFNGVRNVARKDLRSLVLESVNIGEVPHVGPRIKEMLAEGPSSAPSAGAEVPMVDFLEVGGASPAASGQLLDSVDSAPVVTVVGAMASIRDWSLAEEGVEQFTDGAILHISRESPSLGGVRSLRIRNWDKLAGKVRLLRLTNEDMGTEYLFAPSNPEASSTASVAEFVPLNTALMVGEGGTAGEVDTVESTLSGEKAEEELEAEVDAEAIAASAAATKAVVPEIGPGLQDAGNTRYEIFLGTDASSQMFRRGDLTLTLTGTHGRVSIPVPVVQDRSFSTYGQWQSLLDQVVAADGVDKSQLVGDKLKVGLRDSAYFTLAPAKLNDPLQAERTGYFAFEGPVIGELRYVDFEVTPTPSDPQVWSTSAQTQTSIAVQMCNALLSSDPTNNCAALAPGGGKLPNFDTLNKDFDVVGLTEEHCEIVLSAIQQGNNVFFCEWDDEGKKYKRTPGRPGDEEARKEKELREMEKAGKSEGTKALKGVTDALRGRASLRTSCRPKDCSAVLNAVDPRPFFRSTISQEALADSRYVSVTYLKVFDLRSDTAYNLHVNEVISELDGPVRRDPLGV